MKRLGIIGGLGPMATAYFLQLIIEMTDADTDQEHIEVLLHNKPQTPDRTRYILGLSNENPMPFLLQTGRGLVAAGAEILAIPCITAHYFQEQLEKEISCPIIHAIEETAKYLREEKIKKIGIMATDGTIESQLFQKILEREGISCIIPTREKQKYVMNIIYDNVKAGKTVDMELFEEVSNYLFKQGAEVVILGCTELSMVKRDCHIGAGFLDVMDVLARKAVISCGNLKKEYNHLITS